MNVFREGNLDSWWIIMFWTGPIGIGFFFMGLDVRFWGINNLRTQ